MKVKSIKLSANDHKQETDKPKSIKQRVMEYFFLNPTSRLRVRQVERAVGAPLPSVIRYVRELEKERILRSGVVAGVRLYSADRASQKFLFEKKCFNIRQLFEVGLIEFLLLELSNPPIIVFGSYSRGEDVEDSDIDLYIETPSKRRLNVEKYAVSLQRKIQIFFYPGIASVENKNLANNIVNGSVLNGFLEVFK